MRQKQAVLALCAGILCGIALVLHPNSHPTELMNGIDGSLVVCFHSLLHTD